MTVESFLTESEELQVVDAIRIAEKMTSGEIRVHLEAFEHADQVFKRAKEVFHFLKMDNTEVHNGVIIYVAVNLKQFVVYGDKGIHQIVGDSFWQSTRDAIQVSFKEGNFVKGLTDGITEIGRVLQQHFPWQHNDINELPDEISKG